MSNAGRSESPPEPPEGGSPGGGGTEVSVKDECYALVVFEALFYRELWPQARPRNTVSNLTYL